jgi:predicted ester cyclase
VPSRYWAGIQIKKANVVEDKARVAWQRTLRGKHEGKFKGIPATGLQVIWRGMVTSQFRDGLIAEEWVISDLAEQLLLSRKRKS